MPDSKKERLVLFSAFFESPEIPSFIKTYLERLRPHAKKLVFITQQERKLSQQSSNWLAQEGFELAYVPNGGMDFGMWSKVSHMWSPKEYDSLVLANDSCFSLRPFNDFFKEADAKPQQLIGMTDSIKKQYHLQSYFLYARTPDCATEVISFIQSKKAFLDTAEDYSKIVETCEIGLSQHIAGTPMLLSAIWSHDHRDPPLDQTYIFAHQNAARGMPLIKRKFLAGLSSRAVKFMAYNSLELFPTAIVRDLIEHHGCSVKDNDEIFQTARAGDLVVTKRLSAAKRYQHYRKLGLKKQKYLIPSLLAPACQPPQKP